MTLPFSPACERNKGPILEELKHLFSETRSVLEVGSGTGQHAVHFAPNLPHLTWLTSDVNENHDAIQAWIQEMSISNIRGPVACNLHFPPQELGSFDGIFSANTLHIISWELVQTFFRWVPNVLNPGGLLVVYGPFNENGAYTSESNQQFDGWLKNRDPLSGIRNRQDVMALADKSHLVLQKQITMPANNQILVWSKSCGT